MNNPDNNLNYSVAFQYPDEAPPERHFDITSSEVVIRISSLLFSSDKPKVALAALLYAAGVDVGIYLGTENTETAIAKALGESKQNFSKLVKQQRKTFNFHEKTTNGN